jgi:hypothetical protein
MMFRTRLLLIFAVAVAAAVGMVELVVSSARGKPSRTWRRAA